MSKLLILKGLPASGKTTYALELVKKGWKRVNKDDLRSMIDGGKWSRVNEKQIVYAEKQIALEFLIDGFNVVVDDTNFAHEEEWKDLAQSLKASFEVLYFPITLPEAIERDSKRGEKSIGAKAIQRMYDQYCKPKPVEWSEHKQNCYIFDIDGTLAKNNGRSVYDYSMEKDSRQVRRRKEMDKHKPKSEFKEVYEVYPGVSNAGVVYTNYRKKIIKNEK